MTKYIYYDGLMELIFLGRNTNITYLPDEIEVRYYAFSELRINRFWFADKLENCILKKTLKANYCK